MQQVPVALQLSLLLVKGRFQSDVALQRVLDFLEPPRKRRAALLVAGPLVQLPLELPLQPGLLFSGVVKRVGNSEVLPVKIFHRFTGEFNAEIYYQNW